MWEKIKEFMDDFGITGKNFTIGFVVIIVLIAGVTAYNGAFTIAQDSQGVITRYGKYNRTVNPGLGFKIPYIEQLKEVKTKKVFQAEFGFSTSRKKGQNAATVKEEAYGTGSTALMLTGDLNVVVAPWLVQFKIKDPKAFLFNVEKPLELLRDTSIKVIRAIVGDRSVVEIIAEREQFVAEGIPILQADLNKAESGIQIVTIEMQKTDVPGPVRESFNAVNIADQAKQKRIFQAQKEYNDVIPNAAGQAKATIERANGYAIAKVNKANGDVVEFNLLYAKYLEASEITLQRLYYETMDIVALNAKSIKILDGNLDSLLPLLNVNK